MAERVQKRQVFDTAPEEELLYSISADGSRKYIHPVVTHGRFWRIRIVLGWILIAIYLGLPIVTMNGKPAMLLDVVKRQFHFLGSTFHPTDNLILLALGGVIGALVFFVTGTYGRIWCGYGCPQTVYLEFVFRPIETLLEGKPKARIKRNAGPWTQDKILRKSAKWALYVVFALLLSATFVAYFVGWSGLLPALTEPLTHRVPLGVTLFVTAAVLVDFGYFRDQMCTVACPYGRLQNVLVDDDTIVVAYDEPRGEPRGKAKTVDADGRRGDCIDCKRCIQTCPTGMDIRRGLQMECVGCAQCIEACDEVMERLKRPRGLIRYASTREISDGKKAFWRPRVILYLALLLVALGSLTYLSVGRGDARIEIIRGGREPFRLLHTGQVANQLRIRITNQRHEQQSFTVSLAEPAGADLVVSVNPIVVPGDRVATANIAVKLERNVFQRGRVNGRFVIRSDRGAQFEQEFLLLGPYR
ncbi:MAG: cytochrome c oxidase accessory protein CcoG [Deltaproteobacteria bacterium]|jgi:cytochrome c oxidase accessory protein FixG|nr:cytochrome c oxidase accessory protein CcoG [Deltaproteobacteria bacterium]MBW2536321.1 cytochrome c oxidase accessory protein CcoG [Deltaproteobacteria bacterium]